VRNPTFVCAGRIWAPQARNESKTEAKLRPAAHPLATSYIRREARNPSAKAIRQTKPAIVHMEDLATFRANIAGGLKGNARPTIRTPTPASKPNTVRSAQKKDLYAIETAMKIRSREKRAVIGSTRCRTPLAIKAQDHIASIRQKIVTSTSVFRLLSSACGGHIGGVAAVLNLYSWWLRTVGV
jgi:hypothetical protein